SEFGRRPQENASRGTDHGTAAPVFLIGDPVKGGLYGQGPDLAKLDASQNVSFKVDFRSVYQEILGSHLGVDGAEVLGASFDRIPFLLAAAWRVGVDGEALGALRQALRDGRLV